MSEIRRYRYYGMPARSGPALYRHWEDDDGEWVKYDDAKAMQERIAELEAKLAEEDFEGAAKCAATGGHNGPQPVTKNPANGP